MSADPEGSFTLQNKGLVKNVYVKFDEFMSRKGAIFDTQRRKFCVCGVVEHLCHSISKCTQGKLREEQNSLASQIIM